MNDRTNLQRSSRKTRDRSIVLVLLGTALLMPPIAGVFLIDGMIAGLPIPMLYVFTVWILLIAGAAALSRALREGEDAGRSVDIGEGDA